MKSFLVSWMKPYHVRPLDNNVPWQQCFESLTGITVPDPGIQYGTAQLEIKHLTDSNNGNPEGWNFDYRFMNRPEAPQIIFNSTMLLDEVNKKLYFIHSPNFEGNDFIVYQARIEIEKISDGSRKVMEVQTTQLFLGRVAVPRTGDMSELEISVKWFLNPFDGSIFQIDTSYQRNDGDVTSFHTISWIKLGDDSQLDTNNVAAPNSMEDVKVMDKSKVEFPQDNWLDPQECGILFSEGGKKFLMRFRITNPDSLDYAIGVTRLFEAERTIAKLKNLVTSVESPFTQQMSKPPTYALFGLNYDAHTIQLLTQFVPSSQVNHAELLISSKLLPVYAEGIRFPNSAARSFLSQRSHMIGQYLKYTFFSTINKGAIAVVAVKSLIKTLQNGQLSLAPKKVWFPLKDDRVRMAFENLSEKTVKWNMLAQKHNVMLVYGNEFILQVYELHFKPKGRYQLGAIRVKLGVEYKDYRKCASCGKMEEHKRRSKSGKRISQFKVCGWCKDHNLHKMWWEVPCHYCSEECADNHWPIHQLQHNIKHKGKKGKGKKKKCKK